LSSGVKSKVTANARRDIRNQQSQRTGQKRCYVIKKNWEDWGLAQ
jgi:hypothetical protein